MEKDLRDAYKALKLMRADLTRTKKEKQALEHQLSLSAQQQLDDQSHNGSSGNPNDTSTRATERALMQEEDARAQLVRLQVDHDALQHEHEVLKMQTSREQRAQYELEPSREVDNQDEESEFTVETEPVGSNNGDEELRSHDKKSKQHEPQQPEETSIVEEMVREKLGLLANLYTLKTKADEQATAMLAQQAAFARERDELCMQLEELSEQMVVLQAHAMDVEHEKQFIEEKYDFLVTELELIKQTQELSSNPQSEATYNVTLDSELVEDDRTELETKLRELEAIREQLEAERGVLRLQQAKSLTTDSGEDAIETGYKRSIEDLIQTNANLLQQLAEKDEQLAEKDEQLEDLNSRFTEVLRERDSARLALEEAKKQKNENNKCQAPREALVADLEEERTKLHASLAKAQDKILELKDVELNAGAALLRLEESLRAAESEKSDLLAAKETLERDIEVLKCDRASIFNVHKQKLDTVSQTNLILQQHLQEKELEIAVTKDEMKRQVATYRDELVSAIQGREHTTEELRGALKELEQRDAELIQRRDQVRQLESHALGKDKVHKALTEQFHEQQQLSQRLEQDVVELNKAVLEKEERLDVLQLEADSLREKSQVLGVELVDNRETVSRLEAEKLSLEQQFQELQGVLQHQIEALQHSHEQQLTALEHGFVAQEAEKLSSQQTQHEKALKGSAMEIKALLHELRQLKQSLKLKEDELVASQSAGYLAKTELVAVKDDQERANSLAAEARDLLQQRLSVLETQLMEIEDKKRTGDEDAYDDFAIVDGSDVNARAWAFIKQKVRALDRFLPQLQSFAYFLDMTLCLCESNASTLEALSVQHVGGGALTQEIVSFLRFITQLQRGVGATSHVKQGRRLHRQVLELLANWFECGEHNDTPAPPFGIASRETSLVLHNWTADKTKRVAAKQWLERIESVTGVSSPEECESLAAEGSTFELQQMSMEVKQAFLMLIVPILKRNPAIYVRVFTRKAMLASTTPTGVEEHDDANWEMKIHVQLADTLLRRRSSSGALLSSRGAQTASSPSVRARPPPLKLLSMHHGEPEDQSISTPTSAQKLQIIQERLQRMQSR